MKKSVILFFLIISIYNIFCKDDSSITKIPNFTFYNLNEKYDINCEDIKNIDFQNLKYNLRGTIYKLKDGKFEEKQKPFGFDNVYINEMYFYNDSNKNYAIIHITHHYGGGSSCLDSFIQLFNIKDNYLYCISSIFYYNSIQINFKKNGEIKVNSTFYFDDDPNCCPSGIEEDIFKIINNNLKLDDYKIYNKK